ncbi:hypothetical protein FS837_008318 [Tulasnella sp. UAMH 9824]|nr:hypothetical protein FS837_008318 [Tulasnella sp. UAMH 9824]
MSPYGRKDLQRITYLVALTPKKGHGPVMDLRFSPNGRWLAASFADGTVGVWQVVGDKFGWHSTVAARSGSIVWSPDSRSLLVRVDDGLMIWCPETRTHLKAPKSELDAFTWASDGEDLVAAAGHFLWTLDKETGNHKRSYPISSHPLRVHDIASVPGSDEGKERLLVIVCSIQDEPWGEELYDEFLCLSGPRWQRVRPKDVQPQRRIIVYDISRGEVAAAVPIRNEAQHVTVSRNGKFVLISYGPSSPPELWHIEKSGNGKVILGLCHMYLDNSGQGDGGGSPYVVGQARFGGDCDDRAGLRLGLLVKPSLPQY